MTALLITDKGPWFVDLADHCNIRECHWTRINYLGGEFFNVLMMVLMPTFRCLWHQNHLVPYRQCVLSLQAYGLLTHNVSGNACYNLRNETAGGLHTLSRDDKPDLFLCNNDMPLLLLPSLYLKWIILTNQRLRGMTASYLLLFLCATAGIYFNDYILCIINNI